MQNTDSLYQLSAVEARWFAIYTGFRKEKVVVNLLKKKGIAVYLPMLRTTKRWVRKIKTYEVPLINCYVFVHITKNEYVKVLETEYVLNFVKTAQRVYAIPQAEIDIMRRITLEGEDVRITPTEWSVNDEVEILYGNLAGMRGSLIAKEGKHRLRIALQTLGYTLELSVEENWLRKLQSATA